MSTHGLTVEMLCELGYMTTRDVATRLGWKSDTGCGGLVPLLLKAKVRCIIVPQADGANRNTRLWLNSDVETYVKNYVRKKPVPPADTSAKPDIASAETDGERLLSRIAAIDKRLRFIETELGISSPEQ